MSEPTGERPPTRRDEYAEVTRLAVVDAARELFGANGYVKTKVDEIARRARVSPATVYAQCGGKQGLLETLMDMWTSGTRVQQIIDDCRDAGTAREKLSVLAVGYVLIYAESGDIIRIVTEAAASIPAAAEFLHVANLRHQEALAEIVAGIRATGEIVDDLSDEDVVRTIFYHFRYEQFTLASEEFGWGVARARDTIREWLAQAILKSQPVESGV
ncbi:TetR/AcrR family transcriptional regulator [Actinoallomurus vinaceus]|uniref:TetR/AcrR family transcriptional regulator n=1 Tax=Actinoallomurus vinaceus TaxID=1080074 RepID=A0ABP8TZN5_9ACTN